MVSKEKVKKKKKFFFFTSLYLGKTDIVLGKRVAIFDWEWSQNSAPRDGQKNPWYCILWLVLEIIVTGPDKQNR